MGGDTEHKHWAVMFNDDGHISMTPSDGKPTPFGTKMYKFWTVVATDLLEADARAYVRMNWKDMTPYSVAKTLRDQKKYSHLSDTEFDALWYRQTLDEFKAKKDSFLEEEAKKEAEEKIEEEEKKAAKAAKAAEAEAVEAS